MNRWKNPAYSSWRSMVYRCTSPLHEAWSRYGGRGITVCERWHSFENFLADVGPRPSLNHSIDRFPNKNGNYEPANCRWATRTDQARNRRSNKLDFDLVQEVRGRVEHGESQCSVGRRMGIAQSLVSRIVAGAVWQESPMS